MRRARGVLMLRSLRRSPVLSSLLVCAAGLGAGCSVETSNPPDEPGRMPNDPKPVAPGQSEFESAHPNGPARDLEVVDEAGVPGATTGGAAPPTGAPSAGNDGGPAARAIEEADIIKIEGGRLYALRSEERRVGKENTHPLTESEAKGILIIKE